MFMGKVEQDNLEFAMSDTTKRRIKTAAKVVGAVGAGAVALKAGGKTKLGKSFKTGFKAGAKSNSQLAGSNLVSRGAAGLAGGVKQSGKRVMATGNKVGKSIGTKINAGKQAMADGAQRKKVKKAQVKKLQMGMKYGMGR